MYIANETYFQAPKREIPNLDEADSKAFAELERMSDYYGRLLMSYILTPAELTEFNSFLVNGIFPSDTTGIPQKWIDLVNGKAYTKNDVSLVWNGLIYSKGTYKGSVIADYVYHYWLETQVSYMTGVGDAKGQPKGAILVNPTQRIITVWNEFVKQYQGVCLASGFDWFSYGTYYELFPQYYYKDSEVSLIQFLNDNQEVYTSENRQFFEVKNQLGL